MEEIWKEIKGYDGKYLVSNLGRVKSLKNGERILRVFTTQSGWLVVTLFKKSSATTYHLHRVVYDAFIGFPADPNLCCVYFKDGDKLNCKLDNLACAVMETTSAYDGGRKGRMFPEVIKQNMNEHRNTGTPESRMIAAEKRKETCRKKREAKALGLEFNEYSSAYAKNREYYKEYHKEYYRRHREEILEKNKKRGPKMKERAKEIYKEKKEFKEKGCVLDDVKRILAERVKGLKDGR